VRSASNFLRRCPDGNLSTRMQRFEEGHQICRVWAQVFPLGGHVPTPLYYLTNQLVLREADSNAVERRPAPASNAVEPIAVVALLRLKNKGPAAYVPSDTRLGSGRLYQSETTESLVAV
jgi:hypothetical protein